MATDDEVRQASKRFYAALNRMAEGDPGEMPGIWSQAATVTTMHPVGGREVGWDAVAKPWAAIAGLCSGGEVALTDQLLQVGGDMAYETGTERGRVAMAGQSIEIDHRVTNVYRREADGWKIVHHHVDLSPAMIQVIKGLGAAG